MSIQLVVTTCQELVQAGKKPSTAMVKAKLGGGVPLAQIIKGLQIYHADPDAKPAQSARQSAPEKEACSCQCAAEVVLLKQELKTLQAELINLRAELVDAKTP